MTTQIKKVLGREVLDSRGNPTLEVELTLSDGSFGRAVVPSGASTGEHEALELRDGDPKRYLGKGVLQAVSRVKEVAQESLEGKSFASLSDLDRFLIEEDGTQQKSKLGGNTILGISMAFAHAVSQQRKQPLYLVLNDLMGLGESALKLPVPMMNILNGGMHANNGLEIQEFMVVPHGFDSFSEALRAGVEVFHHLKKNLGNRKLSTAVGDEGGFAPDLGSNEEALAFICESVEKAGYRLGEQVSLALDVAASSFFVKGTGNYRITLDGTPEVTSNALQDYYHQLLEKFPIVSIEDGLDENDWAGWKALTERFSQRVQLVGDDLFVTQPSFVKRGIENNVANAVLIKVNQVGSLTETFETLALCRENDYEAVVSHRSGESEDVTISHLAVACGCGQIKTGSASRGERTAKYNELLRIDDWARSEGKAIPFAQKFGKN